MSCIQAHKTSLQIPLVVLFKAGILENDFFLVFVLTFTWGNGILSLNLKENHISGEISTNHSRELNQMLCNFGNNL